MTTTLQPRTAAHPAFAVPGAWPALEALGQALQASGLPAATVELVHLRASQINGCGVCAVRHPRLARDHGVTDEQLWAVAAWRDTPFFDGAQRAALALTEALTRIADRPEAVGDAVWEEAARHYDDASLSALVVAIATINLWNRLNVATRQIAGRAGGGW
jgi:AhpD family alkylhydroperoxidase